MTPGDTLAAMRRTPAIVQMADDAWYAGRTAAEAGQDDGANPHDPTSLFGIAWSAGWYTAWRAMAPARTH